LARDATDLTTGGRVCAGDIVMTGPRRAGTAATLAKYHGILPKPNFTYSELEAVARSGHLIDGLPHQRTTISAGYKGWEGMKRLRAQLRGHVRFRVSGEF
jgi:hypothetical protein